MDSFTFQEDVPVFCVTAVDGRHGAADAMQALKALLPANERRHFYGLFWPGRDGGTYKAAASILEGESDRSEISTFTIQNGPYNSFYISDYPSQPDAIDRAFDMLRGQHEVDPDGYCLEWYVSEHDVKCMVPLGRHYQSFTGLNR